MNIPEIIEKQIPYFMKTDGCIIFKLDNGDIGMGYMTTIDNHTMINLEGDCLYLQYLQGDMGVFVNMIKDSNVKTLIYERNNDGKVRKMCLDKLVKRYINQTLFIK